MHCPNIALFLTVVAAAATARGVTAFVPTHVDYFTETELEALAAAASAHQHDDAGAVVAGLRRGRRLGKFDSEDTDDIVIEDDDVGGAEDGVVPDELSPETEELFAAAAAGEDDNAVNNDDDGLTFDPPILFQQYSSDTCDEDALLYSGSIDGITMLEDGVFCIHEISNGSDFYTRLTNTNCTVFGVFDSYVDCTDSACEECSDDEDEDAYYLGLTTWDQIFPQEFEQHCFQQEFATYDNATDTFSMATTFNIDYDFALESSAAALEYKKYIAVHSCIADFVSSDAVTFTSDSVTVTDAATGDSVTVTEDSVTATDADGSSMEIIATDEDTLDVVLSGPEGQSMTVEDATVIMTDDGGVIVENDDQFVATNSDGNWVIVTDDSITYGNDDAFLFVTTDGTNFVEFGSTDGLGGFFDLTIGGLEVEVSDAGVVTLLSSDHAMTFESEYITVSALNGDNAANITEVDYNFTKNLNEYSAPFGADYDAALEDIPFFIITGTIDGVCDTVLIAIGANVTLVAAPECGFLAAETEDGYVIMTDDSVSGGNSEGSFLLNDDTLTISDADGNTVVTADVTSNPDDDDSLIIQNDNFYFAGSEAAGEAIYMTEGRIVVGTEDAFIVFEDDNVTFGSVMTGDNFTLPAEVEINAETGITVTTDDDTMTFTNEYTVILEGPDGTVTIDDVTYNYTQDAFVIMGYFRSDGGLGCDIFIAFNLDGYVVGSEVCDFLFGAKADDDGATDDAAGMLDEDASSTDADDDDNDDNDDNDLIVPCGTLGKYRFTK